MAGIYVSGDIDRNRVYLTPGIQPPSEEGTMIDQVDIHSKFGSYASGGCVLHLHITEPMTPEQKSRFIKSTFNNTTMRYMSLTTVLSVCNDCEHRLPGKHTSCPNCGSRDISIWDRPVGYFRPALRNNIDEDMKDAEHKFWLDARTEEFSRRRNTVKEDIDEFLSELGME